MNLEQYLVNRRALAATAWQPRATCADCSRPTATCYCAVVTPFDAGPVFAILMHRRETKKGVATGRMAHICLTNSRLIEGSDFTRHPEVNALIADPANHCVVLWPGTQSTNLSRLSPAQRAEFTPTGKRLVIFVIDATWAQAKRMKRLSRNLHALPFICFTPEKPSDFRIRVQPAAHCYSTVEAINACLDLLAPHPKQGTLLAAFGYMVEKQLSYERSIRHPRRAMSRKRLLESRA